MHDRVSEILEREVVGEVTRVGDGFFDVGLGRVCLDTLDPDQVEQMRSKLARGLEGKLTVKHPLRLDDATKLIRGLLEVEMTDPKMGGLYLLQITSHPVATLYERRFELTPGVFGDLMGCFCKGLSGLVHATRERPLRLLSGYDALEKRFLEHLDHVVKGSVAGEEVDVTSIVEELAEDVRHAWKLIPWPLKQPLLERSDQKEKLSQHDRLLKRTVIFAADVITGELKYQYVHEHNPLEDYDQALTWMTDVHQAVQRAYPPPTHVATIGRASSIAQFLEHFPRFQRLVGPVSKKELEIEKPG